MRPASSVPPLRGRLGILLIIASLIAGTRALAQGCDPDKGVVSGAVAIGDRSTPPCDFVDLWAIPESGAWTALGKFPWGEIATSLPPGVWRFAAYACDTYFPFRQSAPVRCVRDAKGCVVCSERFDLAMYAMFGGFSGQVTLLPEDVSAGPGIPVAAASGLTCGAEKFAYTDEKGRFVLAPAIEPHRSNHWGLMVDGDGTDSGSRAYFLNADYCENGVTATTFSSTDVTVNLFRVAPYMAANDPSIRPLPQASLLPARPPHEAGPGISLTTGNVALDQTDVAAWGAPGSLAFTRSYNSRIALQRRLSPLGPGWSHTYGAQISAPAGGVLMLHEDDGSPRFFQDKDGDRTYRPSVPITEASVIVKSTAGYVRRFTDGGQEDFDDQGRLTRRVDAIGRVTVLHRDDQGRLASVVDPDGRRLVLGYDAAGYLVRVGSGAFVAVTYTYDADGRLRTVHHPDGAGFAFTYDDSAQLLTMAERNGHTLRTYTYDGNRARSYEIAGGRDRVSIEYSPLKTTVTDVLGRATAYEWSNFRGMRLVTAALGHCRDCGPTPVDPLDPNPAAPAAPIPTPASVAALPTWARLLRPPWPMTAWPQDAAVDWPVESARVAERHTWTYDLQGRLLSHRDAAGTTTHVAYDANGWPITVTDTLGRTIRLTRDAAGRVTSISAPSVANPRQARTTTFAYDTKGRLTARSEAGQNGDGSPFRILTQLGYDDAGRLTQVDGPRPDAPDVTTYTYDASGNLTAIIPAEWLALRFTDHTPFGWPRGQVDANGRALTYTYGAVGRLLAVDDAGDVTSYEYTPGGRLKRLLQPRGTGAIFTYDTYDRLVEVRNAADHRRVYTYDMAGQRTRDQVRSAAAGSERERTFEYDGLGRLSRISVADGRYDLTYDAAGRVASFRAPGADPEIYEYDAGGRLAAHLLPGGLRIALRYDARDQLVSATDSEGGAYSYSYDDLGRVYRLVTPSGATTVFGYDLSGRLAWRADGRGVTTTFERDVVGRVVSIRVPKDRPIVYRYDNCPEGRGRLCEVVDQAGTTVFAYTPKGQIAEETRQVGPTSFVTGYSYDRNGNLSSVRYPSGRVVTYVWDEADHLRSVSSGAAGPMQTIANLSYGADGALSGITYANGVGLAYVRDGVGRVRAIRGLPIELSYAHDARGDVAAIGGGDRAQTFTYDPARQLVGATGSWGALAWAYDPAGNRVGEVGQGVAATYVYEPRTQRLTAVTGAGVAQYGYDAAGRVVRAGDERFVYDDLGQLTIVGGQHRTGEYAYDYKGRRAWKSANGATTLFTYDIFDRLIAESTREGAIVAEYVYDQDRLLARATRSSLAYVHVDALGMPITMTDAKGETIWSFDPRPFGEAAATRPTPTPTATPAPARTTAARAAAARGAIAFPLRAAGRYFDEETGLQRNGYRTYDPRLGRYLEPNPCARPGRALHHSVYGYAAQNPLAFASPDGLALVPVSESWTLPATLWPALLPSPGAGSPECAEPALPR
jgi:RHS repeat-associated protein